MKNSENGKRIPLEFGASTALRPSPVLDPGLAERTIEAQPQVDRAGTARETISRAQRFEVLRLHHRAHAWIPWTCMFFGAWLMTSAVSFGYLNPALWSEPAGGRGVWFSQQLHTPLRAELMAWSDFLAGIVVLVFSWRMLWPHRPRSAWTIAAVGLWLLLAPVLLWAPSAASHINGTLAGMALIALSVVIPGVPSIQLDVAHGGAIPPGWSYNPSAWTQRMPLMALAFLGFVMARCLAAFQLGYLSELADPFFGSSAEGALISGWSRVLPVSDAGIAAVTFALIALGGGIGGSARWRTSPWAVVALALLVVLLAAGLVTLTIAQPMVTGAWSTLNLLSAAAPVAIAPLVVDELIASAQHLDASHQRGDREGSSWRFFWKGGDAEDCANDERSPDCTRFADRKVRAFRAMLWGVSFPISLQVSLVLGAMLMLVPWTFDVLEPAAHAYHIAGALVIAFSIVSFGEPLRTLRWLNAAIGVVAAFVPWIMWGNEPLGCAVGSALGLCIAALALPRGAKLERYGGWDQFVH